MKLYKSLLFVLAAIALLAVVCIFFPQPGVTIGSVELHFPSIDDMFRGDTAAARTADQMLLDIEKTMQIEVVQELDSAQQARLDSLAFYQNFFASNPSRIVCPDDDPTFFAPIFQALDSARKHFVHVIHYGDSQIEGDRISGYLRARLQEKFGGSGPGLLPVVQPIGATSVAQTLSDSLSSYYAGGMMGKRATHSRYGAMAQFAQLHDDSVSITVQSRRVKGFGRLTLYAGHIDNQLNINVGGRTATMSGGDGMQHLTFNLGQLRNKINIDLAGSAEVYGIAIDGGNGVSLSNIPMRGSDGTFFTRIDRSTMSYMLNHLNTRLIIMEFGGNALPYLTDSAKVARFCKGFGKQLDHMRAVCPDARILVIGPADMSVKVDGELQSHRMLPQVVSALSETSTTHGAAYWDMYSVMGGHNSMIAWVDHQPSWAAPDYIHFTRRGADRIASVLWQTLMIYYDYLKFMAAE